MNLGTGRWKAREIKGESANQGAPVGFRRRFQLLLFKFMENVEVNYLFAPVPVEGLGNSRIFGRHEGPELFVGCSCEDPLSDDVLFRLTERLLVCVRRGHDFVLVRTCDAVPELALLEGPRFYGSDTLMVSVGSLRATALIQPETGLAFMLIRSVTGETTVGEQGTDMEVERDLASRGQGAGKHGDSQSNVVPPDHQARE